MVLGVYEAERFIGVIAFGRGATPKIGHPYGLEQGEVCELVRIALARHRTPVSRLVAVALRMLRRRCPGVRLVISYAAAEEGHHGGVYQAGGWIYEGPVESYAYDIGGVRTHGRSVSSRYGRGAANETWLRKNVHRDVQRVNGLIRHKYLMPLDPGLVDALRARARPYPKRAKQATAGDHPDGGGAAPTRALQTVPEVPA